MNFRGTKKKFLLKCGAMCSVAGGDVDSSYVDFNEDFLEGVLDIF